MPIVNMKKLLPRAYKNPLDVIMKNIKEMDMYRFSLFAKKKKNVPGRIHSEQSRAENPARKA